MINKKINRQYLKVTKINKFPALEAGSDSQVHVLDRGPVLPPARFIYRWYPPYSRGSYHHSSVHHHRHHQFIEKNNKNKNKWRSGYFTVKTEEGVGWRAHFLLHCEVVVQWHLLHSRHEALVRVHCSHTPRQTNQTKNNHKSNWLQFLKYYCKIPAPTSSEIFELDVCLRSRSMFEWNFIFVDSSALQVLKKKKKTAYAHSLIQAIVCVLSHVERQISPPMKGPFLPFHFIFSSVWVCWAAMHWWEWGPLIWWSVVYCTNLNIIPSVKKNLQ